MVCVGRGPREVTLPLVHAAVNEIDIRYIIIHNYYLLYRCSNDNFFLISINLNK